MAVVPNVGTDYAELLEKVAGGDADAALLVARKSGRTPFEAALLNALARCANALEAKNA